jgi:SAM-dependent methyltransferase
MFAPDHEAVARELARVTRPGGRIALASWTPTGGLAKMFAVMRPYLPAPPPSNPFDWGDENRVQELLGESFELDLTEHVSTLRVPSGQDYWELFSTSYGPTKTLADSLGERRADLERDWVEFFESNYRQDGEIVHVREYLLALGTRR